jgi:ABC-type histidine transport system ATPase subunit
MFPGPSREPGQAPQAACPECSAPPGGRARRGGRSGKRVGTRPCGSGADAPVLVLDEPTSALDAETEALVVERVAALAAGRTTIIIAHRLSTLRRADQVLVLEEGRVAERGRWEALLVRPGRFRHYYDLQMEAAS